MKNKQETNKFIIKGTKKLLGLTRTKIRLAKESKTIYTKPRPLALVKLLSKREIETVDEAEEYINNLKIDLDYDDSKNTAKTILELMDIIEGVKYKYEPPEYITNLDKDALKGIEQTAIKNSSSINILLMTRDALDGLNLFVGENPQKNAFFLSRVPTTLAFFLAFAFNSEYFSGKLKLKDINIILGHRTLITNAIYFAIKEFGAGGIEE